MGIDVAAGTAMSDAPANRLGCPVARSASGTAGRRCGGCSGALLVANRPLPPGWRHRVCGVESTDRQPGSRASLPRLGGVATSTRWQPWLHSGETGASEEPAMLSWGAIAYGAVLSAVFAVLLVPLAWERRPAVLAVVALGAGGRPVGWNAILRATDANQFFHDAPIAIFPVSWARHRLGRVLARHARRAPRTVRVCRPVRAPHRRPRPAGRSRCPTHRCLRLLTPSTPRRQVGAAELVDSMRARWMSAAGCIGLSRETGLTRPTALRSHGCAPALAARC